ncbi:hypothetical protein AYL99_08000 [Fonsecaea erecta]|uniref:Uncharacterized protein n=1 Tax=Fonsecaea erecta TaxID=1367422 RepID=A0A178ZC68_9EURO|nr:hypothetical protein AYL99_08000 [Fonsecaea erecta]OAP57262.1 hypothetical protein AYL99_08000 [Fonsecaea erecta]
MNEAQAARVGYLQRSARVIFLSAPSTSRQLLRESVELGHRRPSHGGRGAEDTCMTCGNLMLPEWTVSTKITDRKAHAPKKKSRQKVRSRRCSLCSRVIKDIATMDSSHAREAQQLVTVPTKHGEEVVATAPADPVLAKPVKLSSKKRARARKDREGLQALLNKSMQAKSTLSLDLMDLMKK